jgi:hypothetical protein
MRTAANPLSVFVKPWKSLSLAELALHVSKLGFDAVELPVRPGFPCQPETTEEDLPRAVEILGEQGGEHPQCDGRSASKTMWGALSPSTRWGCTTWCATMILAMSASSGMRPTMRQRMTS